MNQLTLKDIHLGNFLKPTYVSVRKAGGELMEFIPPNKYVCDFIKRHRQHFESSYGECATLGIDEILEEWGNALRCSDDIPKKVTDVACYMANRAAGFIFKDNSYVFVRDGKQIILLMNNQTADDDIFMLCSGKVSVCVKVRSTGIASGDTVLVAEGELTLIFEWDTQTNEVSKIRYSVENGEGTADGGEEYVKCQHEGCMRQACYTLDMLDGSEMQVCEKCDEFYTTCQDCGKCGILGEDLSIYTADGTPTNGELEHLHAGAETFVLCDKCSNARSV